MRSGKSKKRAQRCPKNRRRGSPALVSSLGKDEAIREARRCLGAGECDLCDVCGLLCPDLCILRNEKTGEVQIDLDYCKGCGICAAVCPKGAIKMIREEGT